MLVLLGLVLTIQAQPVKEKQKIKRNSAMRQVAVTANFKSTKEPFYISRISSFELFSRFDSTEAFWPYLTLGYDYDTEGKITDVFYKEDLEATGSLLDFTTDFSEGIITDTFKLTSPLYECDTSGCVGDMFYDIYDYSNNTKNEVTFYYFDGAYYPDGMTITDYENGYPVTEKDYNYNENNSQFEIEDSVRFVLDGNKVIKQYFYSYLTDSNDLVLATVDSLVHSDTAIYVYKTVINHVDNSTTIGWDEELFEPIGLAVEYFTNMPDTTFLCRKIDKIKDEGIVTGYDITNYDYGLGGLREYREMYFFTYNKPDTLTNYVYWLDDGENSYIDSISITYKTYTNNIAKTEITSSYNVMPNPFNNQFVIDGLNNQRNYNIQLYNLSGKLIKEEVVSNRQEHMFETAELNNGVYLLRLVDNLGNTTSLKLIKQ